MRDMDKFAQNVSVRVLPAENIDPGFNVKRLNEFRSIVYNKKADSRRPD